MIRSTCHRTSTNVYLSSMVNTNLSSCDMTIARNVELTQAASWVPPVQQMMTLSASLCTCCVHNSMFVSIRQTIKLQHQTTVCTYYIVLQFAIPVLLLILFLLRFAYTVSFACPCVSDKKKLLSITFESRTHPGERRHLQVHETSRRFHSWPSNR